MTDDERLEAFKNYYRGLKDCCLRSDTAKLVEDSVRVLWFVRSEPDGDGAAVTELSDGRFAVFEEWQDYSGHG